MRPADIGSAANIFLEVLALRRSEKWPADKIRNYQHRKLAEQLRYAVETIPYYQDLNISAHNILGPDDLGRFPTLSKRIIQSQCERLFAPGYDIGEVHKSLTSGSTGEPTTTLFDPRCWRLCKYALKIRRMQEAGSPWGQRLLIFDETAAEDGSVTAPVSLNLLFYRQTRLSVFVPMEEQYGILRQVRPTTIYGSPSGIKELCDYATAHDLPLPQVTTVFLASELIADAVREQIARQLGARVVGIYGSTEFKEIAHQCPSGRYHINFESVYVEAETDDDNRSRLLITSLVNRAMPLIRFDIGDYASFGSDPCVCGRESPYLEQIVGREAEFLQLPDGRRLSPYRLTTAIESIPGLVKYQFVQLPNRLLELRFVLRTANDEDAVVSLLRERLQAVLGNESQVRFTQVTSIPRTNRGKHQVVRRATQDAP